ncbi:MAG: hypothetical protein MJ249_09055, partial [Kiritimatiellae bacterium]|nr:hypothetical protein [Kiritimatiellia bacterium]
DEGIPPRLFEPYTLIPLGHLETRLIDVLNGDYLPEKGTTGKATEKTAERTTEKSVNAAKICHVAGRIIEQRAK